MAKQKQDPEEVESEKAAEPIRGRQSTAPECPYHKGIRTKAGSSDPRLTRYYCPVEGCAFSVKVPRPQLSRNPLDEGEEFAAR